MGFFSKLLGLSDKQQQELTDDQLTFLAKGHATAVETSLGKRKGKVNTEVVGMDGKGVSQAQIDYMNRNK